MADVRGGGDRQVHGTVAHDSPDVDSPVKIGGKASQSLPAAVSAAGDRVDAYFDMYGRQHVVAENETQQLDVFARTMVASPNNDIDVQFFRAAPEVLVDVSTANSATATQNVGGALFASSTNANGSVQGVTRASTVYRSGSEIYCMFTATFTAGIANSYMRIGLYDANNGFFIGYEGTTFEVNVRNNAVDTGVAKGSWSEDTLTGAAGSRFTRAGTPEAIDFTKLNVFRIRFGWLGSAPVYWEVMAPDGHWVCFHKTLFPNLQATPSIRDADLPITLDITKTAAAATDLQIQTDCWGAGATLVEQSGLVDVTNSRSAATLDGGTSWNASGPWVDVHRYAMSTVTIDSTSAESGTLQVEFSMDGATAHRAINYTVSDSSNHPPHALIPVCQFMRVSFDADGTSPTNDHAGFIVQTIHHVYKSHGLVSRVNQTINDDTDVDNVRAVLVGKTGGGSYVNVGTTTGGGLKMDMEEIQGTALDVNTGNASAGTQRVVLATDQPAVTVDLGANNDVTATGNVAHDAVDSGNPVKLGGHARTGDPQTAVANADRVDAWFDASGRLVVSLDRPPAVAAADEFGPYYENVTASGDTQIIAGTASQSIYVKRVWLSNNSGSATIKALLREGAAGTIRAGGTLNKNGGGVMCQFDPAWKLPANTDLTLNLSATGDVSCNVLSFWRAP